MPIVLDDYIYCSPFCPVLSWDHLCDEAADEGISIELPAPLASGDERLHTRTVSRILRKHVERLPKRQQLVILGIFYDGLSPTETARHLGISGAAVTKLKAKALRHLLTSLGPRRGELFA